MKQVTIQSFSATSPCAKNMINVVNGRVRAQLSLIEKPLLGGRHVSAPMLGHHKVL
jgi:hypothetical protein